MSHLDEITGWIKLQGAQISAGGQATADYTGATHVHYGIPVPSLRGYLQTWAQTNKALIFDEWTTLLEGLYHGDSVDGRSAAGMLLNSYPAHRRVLPLDKLETWLDELEGWAEVDGTCQSTFTPKELDARWDAWQDFLRKLAQDENINKRRASLVLLIRAVRESEDARFLVLALELVDLTKDEKDILITKAISWILREGIKQHKPAIAAYLEANAASLPSIAVRETRTKLTTGKK